jgi:hypothetical protein
MIVELCRKNTGEEKSNFVVIRFKGKQGFQGIYGCYFSDGATHFDRQALMISDS